MARSHIMLKKDLQNEKIFSLIWAVYISLPGINAIATAFIPRLSGIFMSTVYIFCVFAGILYIVMTKCGLHFQIITIGVISFVMMMYVLLYLLGHNSDISLVQIFIYFMFPMAFFGNISFDKPFFIKLCVLLPSFGVLLLDKIFILNKNNAITMGVSYAFILPVIASLVYLLRIRPKHCIYTLASAINMIYTCIIFLHGSRGAVMSVIVAMILLFALRYDENKRRINVIKLRFFVMAFTTILIAFNLTAIIEVFIKFLADFGISIRGLNKMLMLSLEGDITNGRTDFYVAAMQGIIKKPLLGHGIGMFEYYTGLQYPHNFFLQMLYDLGIIGTVILMVPAIKGLLNIFRSCSEDEFNLIVILIAISVPRAMFSGDLWKNVELWLLMALLIKKSFRDRCVLVI